MERCPACGRRKELYKLDFMPRELCLECIVYNVEKRIRKNIRKYHIIKPKESIFLERGNNLNCLVLKKILSRLKNDLPFNEMTGGKKIFCNDMLDFDIELMNMVMFSKKPPETNAPLNVVHPKEIELLGKFFGIKGRIKHKERTMKRKLLELEKKYPAVLFSIRHFYDSIKNLRKTTNNKF